ncbi:hypothetical protein HMPREF0083_03569 [Aneurinibacillus aneurinilyticus ATCC 12856]|uniref:Uncharacterized protein n=1 Tax=Aneurinibacillus aneurinilyticus ATCC 12856 TaxID=649747 RepID=U1Y822_ANEAE|nr:hypothetical protein HMPREF0083_03569 [Aneurinibacillus aneurinilyticus ATCC 12856]
MPAYDKAGELSFLMDKKVNAIVKKKSSIYFLSYMERMKRRVKKTDNVRKFFYNRINLDMYTGGMAVG